jgi:hypothetical protein
MATYNDTNTNVVFAKELGNHTIIHEHDFVQIRAKRENSFTCTTCGLIYCENCGKRVN